MITDKLHCLGKTKRVSLTLFAVGVLTVLGGCSAGSGPDNDPADTSSTNTGGSTGPNYSGPAAATPDIQNFRAEFWGPMVSDQRCTECHQQGGDGNGFFVRDDDINLAYQAAFDRVDLTLPSNSLLVQRVASGHGCWLSDNNACAQIVETLITNWAVASGTTLSEIALTPPAYSEPGTARNFPTNSDGFRDFVWNALLRQGGAASSTNPLSYCSQCHSEDSAAQQQPWFAHADVDTAYDNARGRINLDTPSASRFVTKLQGGHNCWTPSDCAGNAATMQQAIADYAATIPSDQVDPDWNVSGAVNLEDDGIEAVTGGRVQNNVIASYTFVAPQDESTGNGAVGTVFDVSGVSPAADLRNVTAGGNITWSGSRGVRIAGGRLQTTLGSEKFRDLIGLTGEYSIETWVAPDNVVLDNSARIVTYSQDQDNTNFLLGQTLYNYDFFNRSNGTSATTGGPAYSTPDADEILQATLQHVVVTFDPINGRKIYVNGAESPSATPDSTVDPIDGANIENWSTGMVLGVGSEPGNNRQWLGSMRLLAVHNRALTQADVENNFQVGVGAKFFLMFDLSNAEQSSGGLLPSSIPQAYIVFEVEVFDAASYLFTNPFFISLDSDWAPNGSTLTIEGMRIGINAKLASQGGHAYSKMSFTIDDANYTPAGQQLSRVGTLIPIVLGPQSRTNPTAGGDVFFLTFDRIGIAPDNIYAVDNIPDDLPQFGSEIPDLDPVSDIGIKHMHKLNEAMSAATGVNRTDGEIDDTFGLISRSLPANQAIREFQPAHQMSVVQLGAEYCVELASNNQGFFGGAINFGSAANVAFGGIQSGYNTEKAAVIDPLLESITAHEIASNGSNVLTTQGNLTNIRNVLSDQIDDMVDECESRGECNIADTENIVMATCAAVMSSAALLVQ